LEAKKKLDKVPFGVIGSHFVRFIHFSLDKDSYFVIQFNPK